MDTPEDDESFLSVQTHLAPARIAIPKRESTAYAEDLAGINVPEDLTPVTPLHAELRAKLPPLKKQHIERVKQPDHNQEGDHFAPVHKGGANMVQSILNLSCAMIGVGMLHLPKAIAQSGWAGITILFLSAFASFYAGRLSIKALYMSRDGKRLVTYSESARIAWGRTGSIIVDLFQKLTAFGVCTILLILAGETFMDLVNIHRPRLDLVKSISIVASCMLLPSMMLRNMKDSSWVAVLGLGCSLAMAMIISSVSFSQFPKTRSEVVSHYHNWEWSGIASTGAAMGFAFSAAAVYPQVEKSMSKMKRFNYAFGVSILLSLLVFAVVGISGYLAFGPNVQSPILASLPRDNPLTMFAKILACAHAVMAYPVIFTAVITELEAMLNLEAGMEISGYLYRWILRLAVWSVTFMLAAFIPSFSTWVEILSALTNTAITWIIPPLIYLTLRYKRDRLPIRHVIGTSLVSGIGMVIAVAGTYTAISKVE